MNDGDLLLRRVLEDPADDSARLVYADWLDEHGQSDRAEFIRVQLRLSEMDEAGLGQWPDDGHTCFQNPCPVCKGIEEYEALKEREAKLFALPWLASEQIPHLSPPGRFEWSRGFCETARMTAEQFLTRASAIFGAQPITEVELTDISLPVPRGGTEYTLVLSPRTNVERAPVAPYRMKDWNGQLRIGPFDSLSTACVRYGRDLIGLPPIYTQLDSISEMLDAT